MYRHSWRPFGTCHCNLSVAMMKFFLVKSITSGLGASFKCWIIRISELLDAGLKAFTIIHNKYDKFDCNMSIKIHLLHSHVDCFPEDLSSLSAELGQKFHKIWKLRSDIRDSLMST
jgi:hypothetical protein